MKLQKTVAKSRNCSFYSKKSECAPTRSAACQSTTKICKRAFHFSIQNCKVITLMASTICIKTRAYINTHRRASQEARYCAYVTVTCQSASRHCCLQESHFAQQCSFTRRLTTIQVQLHRQRQQLQEAD